MDWMTPAEVDHDRWRYRHMKPQRGGWNQALWIELQEEWRMAVDGRPPVAIPSATN